EPPVMEMSGFVAVLLRVAPLKTPNVSSVVVTIALLALNRGPARFTEAGTKAEADVLKSRPAVVGPPNGLAPPSATVRSASWINGAVVVLVSDERKPPTNSCSALMLPPAALIRGPARVTWAGPPPTGSPKIDETSNAATIRFALGIETWSSCTSASVV